MKERYAKTLLYAYPNLQKLIDRIDSLVDKKALSSMTDTTDCLSQCEKIVKLTVQKGLVFETKYYLEKILMRLGEEQRAYIEYKYFKRQNKEYFKNVDLTSRNYYRKQKRLLAYICECLDWLGLNDLWFEKRAKRIPYIRKLLTAVMISQDITIKNPKAKHDDCVDVA